MAPHVGQGCPSTRQVASRPARPDLQAARSPAACSPAAADRAAAVSRCTASSARRRAATARASSAPASSVSWSTRASTAGRVAARAASAASRASIAVTRARVRSSSSTREASAAASSDSSRSSASSSRSERPSLSNCWSDRSRAAASADRPDASRWAEVGPSRASRPYPSIQAASTAARSRPRSMSKAASWSEAPRQAPRERDRVATVSARASSRASSSSAVCWAVWVAASATSARHRCHRSTAVLTAANRSRAALLAASARSRAAATAARTSCISPRSSWQSHDVHRLVPVRRGVGAGIRRIAGRRPDVGDVPGGGPECRHVAPDAVLGTLPTAGERLVGLTTLGGELAEGLGGPQVDVHREQLGQQVGAFLGLGLQDLLELALGDEHDLLELGLVEPDQVGDPLRHIALAGQAVASGPLLDQTDPRRVLDDARWATGHSAGSGPATGSVPSGDPRPRIPGSPRCGCSCPRTGCGCGC